MKQPTAKQRRSTTATSATGNADTAGLVVLTRLDAEREARCTAQAVRADVFSEIRCLLVDAFERGQAVQSPVWREWLLHDLWAVRSFLAQRDAVTNLAGGGSRRFDQPNERDRDRGHHLMTNSHP